MQDNYEGAAQFQDCIRNCGCPRCRALVSLIDDAGARLRFSPARAGRLCEIAVVAAAGEMGLHEDEVVQARRDYANHLHIDLQGPTQNADWPIHIHNAANPDEPNRVNLGNAHARYELNRYYISWAHAPGHEISITSLEGLNKYFEDEVEAARLEPPEVRQEMLANAPKSPELIEVTARVFRRNPYVVAEVLEKADGKCQNPKCAKPAPFLRASDGSPYLEVHHKIPLAQGGEDTVDNAIALCPNCHREAHFGGLRFD